MTIKLPVLASNCLLCDDFTSRDISLCDACEASLPHIDYACRQCGIPLAAFSTSHERCGQCIQTPPAFDYTISLFHYENPVSYLIKQMKFHKQLSAAAILASLLRSGIGKKYSAGMLPDALLAVPLHKTRLVKRGFNQSREICRDIVKKGIKKQGEERKESTKLPLLINKVRRVRNTETQTHLNKQQRLKNVKGCFKVDDTNLPKHIVIVDDVITTGVTTNELAKLLKAEGVETVGVWSIARAYLAS